MTQHFKPLGDAYHQQQMDAWMEKASAALVPFFPPPAVAREAFMRAREELALSIWNSGGPRR